MADYTFYVITSLNYNLVSEIWAENVSDLCIGTSCVHLEIIIKDSHMQRYAHLSCGRHKEVDLTKPAIDIL